MTVHTTVSLLERKEKQFNFPVSYHQLNIFLVHILVSFLNLIFILKERIRCLILYHSLNKIIKKFVLSGLICHAFFLFRKDKGVCMCESLHVETTICEYSRTWKIINFINFFELENLSSIYIWLKSYLKHILLEIQYYNWF